MPTCKRCGMSKAPIGRSVADESAGSYCVMGMCSGYMEDPQPTPYWNQDDYEEHVCHKCIAKKENLNDAYETIAWSDNRSRDDMIKIARESIE